MTKPEALDFIKSTTKNKNLIKHMLAVAACMKALAKHFSEDENLWEIAGIVHDADYETNADDPSKHPSQVFEWLEEKNVDPKIIQAVRAHAWGWRDDLPKPETKMDWSIFCCDELTGLIIATTLVHPTRKIADIKVENVLKKWNKKEFAKGVKRENIEYCEPELGIKLPDFIAICLTAMQGISGDLGL
jgi:putative nucleotidyltransferase with HDIG domain